MQARPATLLTRPVDRLPALAQRLGEIGRLPPRVLMLLFHLLSAVVAVVSSPPLTARRHCSSSAQRRTVTRPGTRESPI